MKKEKPTKPKRLSRAARELERYAYLFSSPIPFEEEVFCYDDKTFKYTAEKAGFKVEWEDENAEQIFEEAQENARFFGWEHLDFSIATRRKKGGVEIALAVLFEDEPEDSPFFDGVTFIPVDERVYSAFSSFGAFDDLGKDWAYMHYHPENAFQQILRYGYVKKYFDRETGKRLVGEIPQGEEGVCKT